jgi:thiosulfate dehydrogenase [quinone] large subunit
MAITGFLILNCQWEIFMVNWLRHNIVASILLTIARIWLGFQWLMDGWGKLTTAGGFSAQGLIQGAINKPIMTPDGKSQTYPWYTEMLKMTTDNGNHTELFNFMVSWGEFLVGLGLLVGAFTIAAAFFGLLMNYAFMLAGVVSISPVFILIEFLILMAGFNAGKIGLDRWITPWLRQHLPFLRKHADSEAKIEKTLNA